MFLIVKKIKLKLQVDLEFLMRAQQFQAVATAAMSRRQSKTLRKISSQRKWKK